MSNELRLAGDRIYTALDGYLEISTKLHNYQPEGGAPRAIGFPTEFAHQVDTELAFISAYESKLNEIKVALSRARNYSSGSASVNALPLEILSRIFHLVLAQPCNSHPFSKDTIICVSRDPESISQVCALWRRIALSSGSLWRHIDLSPNGLYHDGLFVRAGTFLARAGDLPIELHITGGHTDHGKTKQDYDDLRQLVSHISNRIEALEVIVVDGFQGFHQALFSKLLSSQHQTLSKLKIRSESNHSSFIVFREDLGSEATDDDVPDFGLELTNRRVESAFAAVKFLHLRGIYPPWYSSTYHELVDLRLIPTSEWSLIGDFAVAAMLQSSPGLRILHFGLHIRRLSSGSQVSAPIYMKDLQVLKLFPDPTEEPIHSRSLLQLLAPGPKPLRLSIEGSSTALDAEFDNFLARTKMIERFCTRDLFLLIGIFRRNSAYLEHVVIDRIQSTLHRSIWSRVQALGALLPLQSLRVSGSVLSESELRLLLNCCPGGTIIDSSDIKHDGNDERFTEKELGEAFPSVKFVQPSLYPSEGPTADWDILD